MTETEVDRVARVNRWTWAYACGWLDGKRDKARAVRGPIPQDERTDYANGYWRGHSEVKA